MWVVGTVTFSAKRSKPMQCAVGTQYALGVSAKRSTHTVGYAVGTQYAVGTFGAKRSNPHSGVCSRYAVHSRYAVGTQYAVGTFSAKRSNPHSGVCSRYAVHSRYTVCSRC